jgi:hypothetical protein
VAPPLRGPVAPIDRQMWCGSGAGSIGLDNDKPQVFDLGLINGADDGNRTRALSLGITGFGSPKTGADLPIRWLCGGVTGPADGRVRPGFTARSGTVIRRAGQVRRAGGAP